MNDLKSLPTKKLEPKENQIRSSYETLLARTNRKKSFAYWGPRLFGGGFFGGMGGLVILSILDLLETIAPLIVMGLFVGSVLLGMAFLDKSQKEIFDKKQKRFFSFMNTFDCLRKFTGMESLGNKKEKIHVIKSFQSLSKFINKWIDNTAPDYMTKLPLEISNRIDQRVIPLLRQEKSYETKMLMTFGNFLYDFAVKVYDSDPSEKDLEQLNEQLDAFHELPEAETPKETSKFYENLSMSKIISIGAVTSTGLFFIINQSELGWGESLIGSLVVGFTSMAFLATSRKRKSSN